MNAKLLIILSAIAVIAIFGCNQKGVEETVKKTTTPVETATPSATNVSNVETSIDDVLKELTELQELENATQELNNLSFDI
ncbi:hypothetical protein [Geoglobus acetivorans]|uniref:Lipoprotein n=1 Tax=Geoglobus acetivorans TaxID=565033 RepID=A0A0A7GFH5_GEOAI|nr:hypothetical protein GACE_0645 [Geoglobus acetivorans]